MALPRECPLRRLSFLPFAGHGRTVEGWDLFRRVDSVVSVFCDGSTRSGRVSAARIVDGAVASATMFVRPRGAAFSNGVRLVGARCFSWSRDGGADVIDDGTGNDCAEWIGGPGEDTILGGPGSDLPVRRQGRVSSDARVAWLGRARLCSSHKLTSVKASALLVLANRTAKSRIRSAGLWPCGAFA